jgi:cell pole-organizing protein PopZ
MSDAKTPPDLEFDEIVDKIRELLAEEERPSVSAGAAAAAGGPGTREPQAAVQTQDTGRFGGGPNLEAEEDVFELTDALNPDGTVRHLAPIGASAHAADRAREPPPPAIERPAEPQADAKQEPELRVDAPRPAPVPAQPNPANDERLVSEVTALAATAAFARLATAPRSRSDPPLVGGRPLDEIVQELLRPLLKTWLDENLPDLVERLVRAEIARVSGRPG